MLNKKKLKKLKKLKKFKEKQEVHQNLKNNELFLNHSLLFRFL